MRSLLALSVAALLLPACATAAFAEKRTFIIANSPDSYGVDRCLSSGGGCGHAVATAYCRTREYEKAVSFHKVDRDDITGSVPAGGGCRGATCDEFVAIECAR